MRQLLLITVLLALASALAGADTTVPDRWQTRVSLDVKDTPLTVALDALFKGTGINYTRDPEAVHTTVTVKIDNLPVADALRKLLPASYWFVRQGDTAVILPRRHGLDKMVDMHLLNVSPRVVLDALCSQGGVTWTGDPLPDRRITVTFKDITVREALDRLSEMIGLTFEIEGKTVRIAQVQAPSPRSTDPTSQHDEIIDTHYVDANDLREIANRILAGWGNAQVVDSTRLIVHSNQEGFDRVRKVIAQIDNESTLRPIVVLTVSATLTWKPAEGAAITINPKSTISAAEGEQALINVDTEVPPNKSWKWYQPNRLHTEYTIRPVIVRDAQGKPERVSVTGKGKLGWSPSSVRLEREFNFAAPLKPGVPAVVVSDTADLPSGRFDIEIKVTAVIVKGSSSLKIKLPEPGGFRGF